MSKPATVKVKFLRTHPEFAYAIGETADINRDAYERIKENGPFFEEITAKTAAETPENDPATAAEAPEKAPTKGVKARKHTR